MNSSIETRLLFVSRKSAIELIPLFCQDLLMGSWKDLWSHSGVLHIASLWRTASEFHKIWRLLITSIQNLLDVISIILSKYSGPYVKTSINSNEFGKMIHLLFDLRNLRSQLNFKVLSNKAMLCSLSPPRWISLSRIFLFHFAGFPDHKNLENVSFNSLRQVALGHYSHFMTINVYFCKFDTLTFKSNTLMVHIFDNLMKFCSKMENVFRIWGLRPSQQRCNSMNEVCLKHYCNFGEYELKYISAQRPPTDFVKSVPLPGIDTAY